MKIIDLLNKIANGEEVPKKIKFNDKIYIYYKDEYKDEDYIDFRYFDKETDGYGYLSTYIEFNGFVVLTDEVEIIEEEKKIPEKLADILRVDDLIPPVDENMDKIWTQTIKNQNKINAIIDYLEIKGDE